MSFPFSFMEGEKTLVEEHCTNPFFKCNSGQNTLPFLPCNVKMKKLMKIDLTGRREGTMAC